jgi:hypothetical protein
MSELTPKHVLVDLFGSGDFPAEVLDPVDAEAQAALDEARAISQGPERAATMKKAGILRKAADSHGTIYAKRGRPRKPSGVVDSVWSKELAYRKL